MKTKSQCSEQKHTLNVTNILKIKCILEHGDYGIVRHCNMTLFQASPNKAI